jgi:hypothetical protein
MSLDSHLHDHRGAEGEEPLRRQNVADLCRHRHARRERNHSGDRVLWHQELDKDRLLEAADVVHGDRRRHVDERPVHDEERIGLAPLDAGLSVDARNECRESEREREYELAQREPTKPPHLTTPPNFRNLPARISTN